jgi:hypothetical protein
MRRPAGLGWRSLLARNVMLSVAGQESRQGREVSEPCLFVMLNFLLQLVQFSSHLADLLV